MSDLKSITALETLISDIAGSHESAAVKNDIEIAGTALSLLVTAIVPNLAPSVDVSAIDTALADTFNGLIELRAATSSSAPTITTQSVVGGTGDGTGV